MSNSKSVCVCEEEESANPCVCMSVLETDRQDNRRPRVVGRKSVGVCVCVSVC
jgi:hypothetical protein